MTKEKDMLQGGSLGHDCKPGLVPGRGRGHGSGRARGFGHGHVPGRGKAYVGHGRGRGRARDAIYRSEQCSNNSVGGRLADDFPPSSAQNTGSITSWPRKQQSLTGLHELLVGRHGISRGYIPAQKGANPTPSAFGNSNRRGGRLSWADMRRQSQHSNSITDDSSEPDVSHRGFLNVGGPDGGWGGRGRGRILDASSVKKPGIGEDNIDVNVWNGQGRGGILYVPGVNFHSGTGSMWWKRTNDRGMMNLRHSVGGCASIYGTDSSQLFQSKEDTSVYYSKIKYQGWKKKTEKKECSSGAKTVNLQPIESSEKVETNAQNSFIPCAQQNDKESNIENAQDLPSDLTCANKQVIDIISPVEGVDEKLLCVRKHSDVNNIEELLQKKLMIKTDDAVSVVPVDCSTEQNNGRKETCKPGHCSPRGGRTRGIVLFGCSSVTDGGNSNKQNADACGRGVEEKQGDPHIIVKPENSCNDKVCGAVL